MEKKKGLLYDLISRPVETPNAFRFGPFTKKKTVSDPKAEEKPSTEEAMNEVVKETAAVAEAVEDVAEEIHEQSADLQQMNREALRLQGAELSVVKEMLKTEVSSARLTIWIFRISIVSMLIALISLFFAMR